MILSKEIRVVQLIDSLEPGGAERMAVLYANALSKKISFSALVSTRAEGDLLYLIDKNVTYHFLNRKFLIDINSIIVLRKFILENRITHLHAHSSSIFFSIFLKFITPKLKIIWHDHYGNSDFVNSRPIFFLKFASIFLSLTITVNHKLKDWSERKLFCKKVVYIPNFIENTTDILKNETCLKGLKGKRIICLANLRPQKNHKMILEVAYKLKKKYPDWTFHLVGKDFNDDYSMKLKNELFNLELENNVFLYGSKMDIANILKQSDIGILTSISEGLPLAILEYGLYGLTVVSTSVGEIPNVIGEGDGFLVNSRQADDLLDVIVMLINNPDLKEKVAKNLQKKISQNYTEGSIMKYYLSQL